MDLDERLSEEHCELDQKLRAAFTMAAPRALGYVRDQTVFWALLKLNSKLTRVLPDERILENRSLWDAEEKAGAEAKTHGIRTDVEFLDRILDRSFANRREPNVLTVSDFLLAFLEDAYETGDEYSKRPFSIDVLSKILTGNSNTPLSHITALAPILTSLRDSSRVGDDDFQYVMALDGDRVVFRVVSVLDDFVHSESGLLIPRRALLTHFRDQFGAFGIEEIDELEDLLNSSSTKEADFQRFFERYPHFLRQWDHREVHSHVSLTQEDGPLIPDFILTDRELQRAAILELKLPGPRIVRRQKNRDRFAAAVQEARSQLLRYRDWFEIPSNRKSLVGRLGMEVYRPQMFVVIGRSSEFFDEVDRARLRSDNPDVELVTYDEIAAYARRRRVIIQ